ncbi:MULTISPECIES: type I secretion system permease/ATPase [Enterobacterales]|jgi:ATP-binding cassette subfamily C protein LapB|uniref:type I secretion system permease/ATPase n=1 Tax=Enterobacterales TaxID=91347 RepID=UPI0012B5F80F|nr:MULTISPECIES: type I secretion system permease/ATPase [Enterobacterales]MCA8711713.1 type I secretion system permease/ATPase [Escherichia coli]MCA8725235.1 type I secretion system permease/ATPase [Escherichia coli]MTC72426.1 type I secretion system permease/ATPase [Providencia sp. wls1914]HDV7139850.1 type I secretion system permease/ATPase [Escherichia coli]
MNIINNLSLVTKRLGYTLSPEILLAQTKRTESKSFDYASLVNVLNSHQFDNQIIEIDLHKIPTIAAPFLALLGNNESVVISKIEDGENGRHFEILTEEGLRQTLSVQDLAVNYNGYSWFIKRNIRSETRSEIDKYETSGFWKVIWRYKKYYYQVIIASFVINLLALISSLYVMNVYDRVIPNQAYETLWVLTIGVVLAIGFEFLAKMLRSYLLDIAGKKADIVISAMLFHRVMGIRLDKRPASSGSYANNLRDFESIREFMTSASLLALVDLPFILLFIGVISMIGGYLALVPLTIIPIVVIAGLLIQKPLAKGINASMKETSQRQGLAVESIEGIETLKLNNAVNWAQQRWEMLTEKTAFSSIAVRNLTNFMVNFSAAMQQLNTVGLVCLGTYLIHANDVNSRITMGALIASVILSGRALAPLGQIAGLATRFQSARMALAGVRNIFSRPIEREDHKKYISPTSVNGALRLANVTYQYNKDGQPALNNINLEIKAGEKVAILGKIGGGKSTLLKLLTGLYEQQQGNISLDDLDIRQIDPIFLRSKVGMLTQKPRLFFGTLRENLDLARLDGYSSDDDLVRALKRFQLDKIIRQHPAGLDMPLGEDGLGLSGGQKQMVALAQLTLHNPNVVLLDEPTTGIDVDTEKLVLDALEAWTKDKTLIVVTHKLPILRLVDRIIVMDEGKILLDGPKQKVLKALGQTEQTTGTVTTDKPAPQPAPQVRVVSQVRHVINKEEGAI